MTGIDGRDGDAESTAPGTAEAGRALCHKFLQVLPVAGGSISLVTELGAHSVIAATDPVAAAAEAWQFGLGTGPHWDAFRTEKPALVYDVTDPALPHTWPGLNTVAVPAGIGAVFAFPLQLGAATVGVADFYTPTPTAPWASEMIGQAQAVAAEVTPAAVRLATRSAQAPTSTAGPNAAELRREVHQATGMVMGQLDCTASIALLRLRGHAFATGLPLEQVAREVITRQLRFTDE